MKEETKKNVVGLGSIGTLVGLGVIGALGIIPPTLALAGLGALTLPYFVIAGSACD